MAAERPHPGATPRRGGAARTRRVLALAVVLLVAALGPAGPANADDGAAEEPKPVVEPRIVGGSAAPFVPHQVVVSPDGSGLCGGSLIHPRWVLTAAHCFDPMPGHVLVGVGSNDAVAALEGGIVVPASAVRRHPGFEPATFRNDVALIQLPRTLRLAPIRVADAADAGLGVYAAGTTYRVSGWGRTSQTGPVSRFLRWADVPIVADLTCGSAGVYGTDFDPAAMVCAGFPLGGVDSCQGDSGGPLWRPGLQVGLTSWGIGCAVPNQPGVYTRLSTYASWIRGHVGRPPNDALSAATPLACPVGTVFQSTAFSSGEGGEPAHAGSAADASVWFRRTASAPGQLRLSTRGSTFDTTLGVYTGTTPGTLVEVGSNDDLDGSSLQSALTVPVSPGATYRVAIDGFARAQGAAQLNWFTTGVRAFTDVGDGHRFLTAIEAVAAEGITTGYADCTFRPGAVVTRGAMAAFLYRADGWPDGSWPSPGFPDVPPSYDFQREVAWMVDAGMTEGYADGTFRPTAPVTRQAAAAFLHRLAGSPPVAIPVPGERFTDVGADHRFAEAIYWMADLGLTNGYDDGSFRPTAPVSRQAMAVFLGAFAA